MGVWHHREDGGPKEETAFWFSSFLSVLLGVAPFLEDGARKP